MFCCRFLRIYHVSNLALFVVVFGELGACCRSFDSRNIVDHSWMREKRILLFLLHVMLGISDNFYLGIVVMSDAVVSQYQSKYLRMPAA